MNSSPIELFSRGYEKIAGELEKLAGVTTSLLLVGDTGTGKDLWASYFIARTGLRPVLILHCGEVQPDLLESEWFGYARGAFTGAASDFGGRLLSARNGIVFFNQIDLLPLFLQGKILRLIESGSYFPLGSSQEVKLRARFLFSAGPGLDGQVARGEFRRDLYYRIAVNIVKLPLLRGRPDLVAGFFDHFARNFGLKVALSRKELKERLFSHPWPGNIRELQNLVRSAALIGRPLDRDFLDNYFSSRGELLASAIEGEWSLARLEREYLLRVLAMNPNKKRAAGLLGISRKKLYRILSQHEQD
jgi:DNA-binding NtrC family response regulator